MNERFIISALDETIDDSFCHIRGFPGSVITADKYNQFAVIALAS